MVVQAYINHGRWVADCPRCNSAELVTPGQRKFQCGQMVPSRMAGGRPWQAGCLYEAPLLFPREAEEIERLLAVRPELNRNWRPGETVIDLRIENAAHGLVVV